MASRSEDANLITSELLDFLQRMRTFVRRMRDDDSFHDVVFVIGNHRFPAHRCLIAAASPVLHNMLTNGTKETEQREIELKEVDATAWKAVFDYIYTAEMELPDAVGPLQSLVCAELFQIEELELATSDYIERELNTPNCSKILALLESSNSTKLRAAAVKKMQENFHEVIYDDEFPSLPFELFLEVISSDELVLRSEVDVFVAVVRWLTRRTKCEVSEDSKDESKECANEAFARKVASVFMKYEFVKPDTVERIPSLFGSDGLVRSDIIDAFELGKLFDCVDLSELSVDDLRRVGKLCRELCQETRTNFDLELAPIRNFGEKVVEKLLDLDIDIPNIPVALYERVPHGRQDVLFTFAHLFHNVQYMKSYYPEKDYLESPRFADRLGMGKWSVKVHFRGYEEEVRDKYVSCFLHRTTEGSGTEEQATFASQIFVDFGNSDETSQHTVYSHTTASDNTQRYSDGQGWGTYTLAPSSAVSGKHTVTVGALLYFKSDHSD